VFYIPNGANSCPLLQRVCDLNTRKGDNIETISSPMANQELLTTLKLSNNNIICIYIYIYIIILLYLY
jgi:hypothetical protein